MSVATKKILYTPFLLSWVFRMWSFFLAREPQKWETVSTKMYEDGAQGATLRRPIRITSFTPGASQSLAKKKKSSQERSQLVKFMDACKQHSQWLTRTPPHDANNQREEKGQEKKKKRTRSASQYIFHYECRPHFDIFSDTQKDQVLSCLCSSHLITCHSRVPQFDTNNLRKNILNYQQPSYSESSMSELL